MVKSSNEPLQPNPFTTYRDPKTGLWVVVKATSFSEPHPSSNSEEDRKTHNHELLLSQAGKVQS
ncbi:hypothetical protein Ple7327_1478 [Pleurocapsa sp. PCC 7327]|uniref:hypothetical protein n=1 Tax=Pleurocapsa sp. PCC 7327 TaxID=118163 RepID=UPI00029FB590|nr:hypothetical protein [Pleurocapsa sp. PCC 7327]AFY76857.1 hypothetical protein Ple7327_1478 [Pleurocapsa sp. PCC 7327]